MRVGTNIEIDRRVQLRTMLFVSDAHRRYCLGKVECDSDYLFMGTVVSVNSTESGALGNFDTSECQDVLAVRLSAPGV